MRVPQVGAGGWIAAIRTWPILDLPHWLVAYIALVVCADLAGIGAALSVGVGTRADLIVFALLVICNAATVELTRRAGENAGVSKDVHAVWELPVAILLPPVYALVMPVLRVALLQWRVRPVRLYRRVFTGAVMGLSYGSASLAFHAMAGGAFHSPAGLSRPSYLWILAVAGTACVQWAANMALMLPAFKGADPTAKLRDIVSTREGLQNDVAELCVAVLVTLGIAVTLITVVFALPFVTLLQRSMRHAQLLNAARIDSKTGLLNAGTWEREAETEVARAVRTRTPLALMLADVDHFKGVNDTYGHLAGDEALRVIARIVRLFVREYDLAGRFGGEEFAVLLPQTGADDACGIAERIRQHIAATPLLMGEMRGPARLTVSIGVAALGETWDRQTSNQLTDLLAAADRALYQAKRAGRDQVCVVTDTVHLRHPEPPAVPASVSILP